MSSSWALAHSVGAAEETHETSAQWSVTGGSDDQPLRLSAYNEVDNTGIWVSCGGTPALIFRPYSPAFSRERKRQVTWWADEMSPVTETWGWNETVGVARNEDAAKIRTFLAAADNADRITLKIGYEKTVFDIEDGVENVGAFLSDCDSLDRPGNG